MKSPLGYFVKDLERKTIDDVSKKIVTLLESNSSIEKIFIDGYELLDCHNAYDEFNRIVEYCISSNIDILLIRIHKMIYGSSHLYEIQGIEKTDSDRADYYNLSSNKNITIGNFDSYIFTLYENLLLKNHLYIEDQEEGKQCSASSNVELPKYLNIKKFIEDKEISFLGLYLLCKKAIREELVPNHDSIDKPIVFFQSIVGSYLASIFAKIACLDMAYLDHIGPKSKIYRTICKETFKNQNNKYLLISDVICMGTEIQIAKSIISNEGSEVIGILPIINIKVIDKVEDSREPKICSLFTLTKENNKEIGYQIITNF
ncbi:MAG: hypothetical protein ACK5MH_09330 [Bacteroidales bacterium]